MLIGRSCVLPTRHCARPRVRCRAAPEAPKTGLFTDISKFANPTLLDQAARRYSIGLDQGFEEDELLALELGVSSVAVLSEAQKAYKDKIKEKLATRAAELRKEEVELKARLAKNLELGKKAYEFGEYPASVKLLEQAVRDVGEDTVLGGEAQLWLGLAYQAVGRESDAIDLYKYIGDNHPSPKVKKQAGDLRYILEAPKMAISPDERVQIPLIQSDTWRQKERTNYTPRFNRPPSTPKKEETYWDRVPMEAPDPLALLPDKWYVRLSALALLVVTTIYLNYAASHQ